MPLARGPFCGTFSQEFTLCFVSLCSGFLYLFPPLFSPLLPRSRPSSSLPSAAPPTHGTAAQPLPTVSPAFPPLPSLFSRAATPRSPLLCPRQVFLKPSSSHVVSSPRRPSPLSCPFFPPFFCQVKQPPPIPPNAAPSIPFPPFFVRSLQVLRHGALFFMCWCTSWRKRSFLSLLALSPHRTRLLSAMQPSVMPVPSPPSRFCGGTLARVDVDFSFLQLAALH